MTNQQKLDNDTPETDSEPMISREDFYRHFLEMRSVETPCRCCKGIGKYMYGSTSTWRGGIGGCAMTVGICDRCWGSGDENNRWLDLKVLERQRNAALAREDKLAKALEWLAGYDADKTEDLYGTIHLMAQQAQEVLEAHAQAKEAR